MKKVQTYQTNDGELFQDKKEAQAHEIECKIIKLIEDDGVLDGMEKMILEILNE